MRIRVIAALVSLSSPALANPDDRLEASGFFGVDYYGPEVGLGGSNAPEQRPQTAPTFGGRLTYIALRVGKQRTFDFGLEGELSFTPAWTGYGFDGPRPSVFSPVLGAHGGILLRLGGSKFQPFATAHFGSETVFSSSKFMADETDPVFLYGIGARFDMGKWDFRVDLRQGLMEAMDGSIKPTYEAHLSVGGTFSLGGKRSSGEGRVDISQNGLGGGTQGGPHVDPQQDPNYDGDHDGIPDRVDQCRAQPESANGIDDADGCPEEDTDHDTVVGSADKCPERAEDLDQFEDTDGCPDDDNDKDGIPDDGDKCPLEAEVVNGVDDGDGCADVLPPATFTELAEASKIKFEKNKVRLTDAAKASLEKPLATMLKHSKVKFTLTVHPEAAGQPANDLAIKRAEIVKWYLVEQGVAEANLIVAIGAPLADKKAPVVVLTAAP